MYDKSLRNLPAAADPHPKVVGFESGNPSVRCAHLVQIIEKRVQMVQTSNALVQGFHHLVGVIGQLFGRGLLLACLQIPEVLEQIQQVAVFLEEPAYNRVVKKCNHYLLIGKTVFLYPLYEHTNSGWCHRPTDALPRGNHGVLLACG